MLFSRAFIELHAVIRRLRSDVFRSARPCGSAFDGKFQVSEDAWLFQVNAPHYLSRCTTCPVAATENTQRRRVGRRRHVFYLSVSRTDMASFRATRWNRRISPYAFYWAGRTVFSCSIKLLCNSETNVCLCVCFFMTEYASLFTTEGPSFIFKKKSSERRAEKKTHGFLYGPREQAPKGTWIIQVSFFVLAVTRKMC